jgi:hypothetical protein
MNIYHDKYFNTADKESGELWFLKAAMPKDKRKWHVMNLLYVFIEPSPIYIDCLRATTSDNYRMHIIDPLSKDLIDIGLTPGRWTFFKSKHTYSGARENNDHPFPNFSRQFPPGEPKQTQIIPWEKNIYIQMTKMIRNFPEITVLNFNFLNDAFMGCSYEKKEVKVSWYGPDKPVVIHNGKATALILPISDPAPADKES